MSSKKIRRARKPAGTPALHSSWIHSSRVHLVLYSFLLVATPFVLLQTFLVEAIGRASGSTVELFGMDIPIVASAAGIVALALLVYLRALITRIRVLAAAVVLLMNCLTQQITDYYFGHNFYDLQQNWHYVAYGIFSYMMYRDLEPRGVPPARIILLTFVAALAFSTFDETFQKFMSSRVFDISDIGKDAWGTLMGIVLVYLGGRHSGAVLADCKRLRHPRLRDYLDHPASVFMLCVVLALLLLTFASLHSDGRLWWAVVVMTLSSYLVFLFLLHVSQYRRPKYILLTLLVLGVSIQSYFFIKHRSDHIVYSGYGLTVYKGIPIPVFDLLIRPNGTFRPVDKKHYFNMRDRSFFLRQKVDILLIGSGFEGDGGHGLRQRTVNQFVYNPHTERATQIITLKTPEAVRVFERLKRERKNVLFVLHSTD